MIAYLRGTLIQIQEDAIILDINGIGYEVICPNPFVYQHLIENELFIYTYHHIREDVQCLFGFKDEEEKKLFTKLISVSGIGPKSAITILATVNVSDFIRAVETEDDTYLTQFPGVGKKTARQIILDLKGKLTGLFSVQDPSPSTIENTPENERQIQETEEALKSLGYSFREIRSILPELQASNISEMDALIKKALSLLVKS